MISTNPEWHARNAALAKTPIYAFSIVGQPRVYTTHDLAAQGVYGALPEYRPWLRTPQGASQSIDVQNSSSSIGELELEVIEQNSEVGQLVASTPLEGSTITLSAGYPNIDYTNFVRLHTYQLSKVLPSRSYTSWLFRARDRQTIIKRTIYTNPSTGQPIDPAEPWVLQGTPAEIVQAIYLFALQRPASELDLDNLRALDSGAENIFKTVRPFLFILTEAFEAKQFLESEIYKPCGLYPVIDPLGRLSLRPSRPPAAGPASVFSFTADNIIVLPEIDRQPIINQIIVKFDDGNSELVFIDADSVSRFGRGAQHVIDSKGLRTVLGAEWFAQEIAARIFHRFASGAPVITVEAFFLTLPVWVGDYVSVTHPLMPDLSTGLRGVTNHLYEVVDREPDYANGKMRYQLLDAALTSLQPAHSFAPSARDFVIEQSEVY